MAPLPTRRRKPDGADPHRFVQADPLGDQHASWQRPPDVSDILPSVRARGVLVPLLVRPNGADDHFEIVAGRRRYFAARAVIEEGGDIDSLPCAVMAPGDDAAALEASLIENLARLDPDPMTQFETFARLTKEGRSVTEIGTTFGVTEIMVKRSLALGNLLPKIREAYRNDEIDDESIRQLTLASKAQQRAWLKLFEEPGHYVPLGHDLKAWLFGGHEIPTEVALFPLDTYSGQIVADLFGEQSYFANTDQFWRLQNEAIAAKRDALMEAGWPEVIILEPGQRFQGWEYEPTAKEQGGRVYVSVSRRGEVEIHEGYLTRKEVRRIRQSSEPSESPSDGSAAKPARCEMSKAMQNYLELYRHAAVRVELLQHPGLAMRLMVAHAIAGSGLWQVEREPQCAGSEAIAKSIRPEQSAGGVCRSAPGGRGAARRVFGRRPERSTRRRNGDHGNPVRPAPQSLGRRRAKDSGLCDGR